MEMEVGRASRLGSAMERAMCSSFGFSLLSTCLSLLLVRFFGLELLGVSGDLIGGWFVQGFGIWVERHWACLAASRFFSSDSSLCISGRRERFDLSDLIPVNFGHRICLSLSTVKF